MKQCSCGIWRNTWECSLVSKKSFPHPFSRWLFRNILYIHLRLFFLKAVFRSVTLPMEKEDVEQLPEIHRGQSVSFKRVIFVRYVWIRFLKCVGYIGIFDAVVTIRPGELLVRKYSRDLFRCSIACIS